jgi:uncharacterized membrane protein (DUF485 family)
MPIERKVQIGYAMGAVTLVTLVAASFNIGTAYWLNILLLLFGGLLGWVTGILATPLDPNEKSQFSAYAAAISTFLTGFVVAKLDKLFELTIQQQVLSQVAFGQALIFGTAFLLGALFTFIGRRYVP